MIKHNGIKVRQNRREKLPIFGVPTEDVGVLLK